MEVLLLQPLYKRELKQRSFMPTTVWQAKQALFAILTINSLPFGLSSYMYSCNGEIVACSALDRLETAS